MNTPETIANAEMDSIQNLNTRTDSSITSSYTGSTPTYISIDDVGPLRMQQLSRDSLRLMQAYMLLVLIANMGLLFLKGYSQDLGYWQDWVRQLSTTGYDGFNGNYPPLYIHWLYLVGQFYTVMAIPLEHNYLLKFLTQMPVALFHCLLVGIIFQQLIKINASRQIIHLTMTLTALNPAILVNGPIWGQVDLIPATITYAALLFATGSRYVYLSIPMFALALLTKFQMIAFAPIFGFLFFKHPAKHLAGIAIAILIGTLVFLPSIIAGHFWMSFRQAYIDTLGQYPMTTFNAANLWILLTGNTMPDSIILFDVNPESVLAKIFTAKYFGMILFSITAFFIFIQGTYFLIKKDKEEHTVVLRARCLFAATICALAFFTLLPAMHERYLFPAVVMALGYFAIQPRSIIYPAAISVFCSLNMLIILEINGSDIWHGLAWLTVGLFVLALLEFAIGENFSQSLQRIASAVYKVPALSVWGVIFCFIGMGVFLVDKYEINQFELAENQRFLTEFPMDYARQDHGAVKVNRSFDNNYLSIGNRRFAQGIGTHANSDIQYRLPEGAIEFSFIVGIDDEVGAADAQFSVWGDDKLLWESPQYLGYERDLTLNRIDVSGVKKLNLKVSKLKEDKWDHVDWINTVLTFEESTTSSEQTVLNE